MSKGDTTGDGSMNIDFMRSLVKQYSELGQWTSALFWADAAAAAAGSGPDSPSGDDVWLLASTMLARGELHRAAHIVTSRGLHKEHLLCLGVAMRAYLTAKEPGSALNLIDEADPMLLQPKSSDQTHNRALASVLVWQARALTALERREAAAKALSCALHVDCACYEALDLLLEQHALSAADEHYLIESLDIFSQLSPSEGTLLRIAYKERLQRYTPPDPPVVASTEAERVSCATLEARARRAGRLAAACRWREALAALPDPWASPALRAACLVELKRSAELFALAHTLVDAYPHVWTSWFAVGCYYYLIGKSEFARRYLSKAKSLEPSAGCVWLAYGHSFAADNEHDQAMAAYFKASQLMPGCSLPPLYVAVECSLLNNEPMCQRFLLRAAALADPECESESVLTSRGGSPWERIISVRVGPHVAHEAGAAAYAAGEYAAAAAAWRRALRAASQLDNGNLSPCWAATLDALGHAERSLGRAGEALRWHERALALRPGRASSLAASGLCLALLGRDNEAADALHAALAKEPDDLVALALLDSVVDKLNSAMTDEDIPQFPFPAVDISLPAAPPTPSADATNMSDMSMSFD